MVNEDSVATVRKQHKVPLIHIALATLVRACFFDRLVVPTDLDDMYLPILKHIIRLILIISDIDKTSRVFSA